MFAFELLFLPHLCS